MNKEQLGKFKEKLYEPYLEAWGIVATLREADLSQDDVWNKYFESCNAFYDKYKNSFHPAMREFCSSLYRVMLDAGDCAKKVWDGEM